jgi:1,4-alpha-glucan branching enzyme
MSLTKRYLKTKPVCKVTFRLPRERAEWAARAAVLGEFNGWSSRKNPMKKLKDGGFTATIELPQGESYEFRYLLDGRVWENDTAADGYVRTAFASENCLLRLDGSAAVAD